MSGVCVVCTVHTCDLPPPKRLPTPSASRADRRRRPGDGILVGRAWWNGSETASWKTAARTTAVGPAGHGVGRRRLTRWNLWVKPTVSVPGPHVTALHFNPLQQRLYRGTEVISYNAPNTLQRGNSVLRPWSPPANWIIIIMYPSLIVNTIIIFILLCMVRAAVILKWSKICEWIDVLKKFEYRLKMHTILSFYTNIFIKTVINLYDLK